MFVASLASGSAGNALLMQAGDEALLIDAGISLRSLERLLADRGVVPTQVRVVLLTHEHDDHALSAVAFARRYGIPLVANAPTLAALGETATAAPIAALPVGERGAIGAFSVESFRVPHDAADPVGYRIQAAGVTVAVAIDLGSWDATTVTALSAADLIVLEANHDRELLPSAPYPPAVRQRISGPRGHLDNTQCGQLLAHVVATGAPSDIWLAHLSRHANTPQAAVAGVGRALRQSGVQRIPRLHPLPARAQPIPSGIPIWRADERWQQPHLFALDE
ncbi:MBL fold metallo-hydrolase [uncultured Chloroflexus sp.]|uniref:MBL fold metallo-hydrolase n=1 Tax=uncultured Chloroflexus sp. TaxID=214040 RepID=UPI0026041F86|nr:MBL fold metallo-hydrolase [uncultured Chloroflexus sp.]